MHLTIRFISKYFTPLGAYERNVHIPVNCHWPLHQVRDQRQEARKGLALRKPGPGEDAHLLPPDREPLSQDHASAGLQPPVPLDHSHKEQLAWYSLRSPWYTHQPPRSFYYLQPSRHPQLAS
ncbi:hypothetical protein QC763_608047 [Podospora pseudopauciseta]|uniref:Uncharacterized protein n=1 Tax=Podospora pseudopauciseta TaxID=2093780 RepID=A0ABR0H658_9PEZI|nr:hypothetical protein QC763_608047 [Podospora pseudopauciseta]